MSFGWLNILSKYKILVCFIMILFIIGAQLPEVPSTEPVLDEIVLKLKEMRDPTVSVQTHRGSGSGTIINIINTDMKDIFEYHVLTNAHVTHSRFFTYLRGVDSITGKIQIETIDTGCIVTTFDHPNKTCEYHNTKVIAENIVHDLAILSFVSDQKFNVAKIANNDMLEQIRVFDEVFAIGCQLGRNPTPTVGIVSQILTGTHGEQEWILYGSTAQITPGSSGGGLFKRYDDHYYLIGVPYSLAVANNGQFI
ncbi:MAG: serine protease, partial [Candidatus Neomarinimicrobiota bacterium]